jgi:hypothetical protein
MSTFLLKFGILKKIEIWKGGRVVECSGFENQRGFTVTGGSNPSLSGKWLLD